MTGALLSVNQLVVKFPGLQKRFNANPWNVSFAHSGLIGLVGPNGSGKTTFLRALLGELKFFEGYINQIKGSQSSFAYLPQEAEWDSYQTVQRHLEFAFFPNRGLFKKITDEDQRKCSWMAQELSIDKILEVPLGDLSSGLRQRVFLGRVLLQEASCYLLDEPTNHLDSQMQDAFWPLVKRLSEKKLFLVSSHDIERVRHFSEGILKMEHHELTVQRFGAILEGSSQE